MVLMALQVAPRVCPSAPGKGAYCATLGRACLAICGCLGLPLGLLGFVQLEGFFVVLADQINRHLVSEGAVLSIGHLVIPARGWAGAACYGVINDLDPWR